MSEDRRGEIQRYRPLKPTATTLVAHTRRNLGNDILVLPHVLRKDIDLDIERWMSQREFGFREINQ